MSADDDLTCAAGGRALSPLSEVCMAAEEDAAGPPLTGTAAATGRCGLPEAMRAVCADRGCPPGTTADDAPGKGAPDTGPVAKPDAAGAGPPDMAVSCAAFPAHPAWACFPDVCITPAGPVAFSPVVVAPCEEAVVPCPGASRSRAAPGARPGAGAADSPVAGTAGPVGVAPSWPGKGHCPCSQWTYSSRTGPRQECTGVLPVPSHGSRRSPCPCCASPARGDAGCGRTSRAASRRERRTACTCMGCSCFFSA